MKLELSDDEVWTAINGLDYAADCMREDSDNLPHKMASTKSALMETALDYRQLSKLLKRKIEEG